MYLFKEIKKTFEHEGKKFSQSFHSLHFPNDFLSLSGFKDIYQSLIILGSYALAAATLPIILNVISMPFAFLCFSVGVFATLFGLYQYIQNPEKNFKVCSTFDVQGHHIAFSGGVMMGIAPLVAILSILIPNLLVATAIIRAYQTIPEDTRESINQLLGRTIQTIN